MRVHKLIILTTIVLLFSMLTIIIILSQKTPEPVIEKAAPERDFEPPPKIVLPSCEYQQTGIITSSESDKEPIILPLFARKVYGRSDRFQYYTTTDKQHIIHLPLQFNNRECEDRIGCDELYTGDKITVTSYENREFTVTIYKRY